MQKRTKTILICLCAIPALVICLLLGSLIHARTAQKAQLDGIRFQVTLTQGIDDNPNREQYGKQCVIQTITVHSEKDVDSLVVRVNSNRDKAQFVNPECLDGEMVEFPSDEFTVINSAGQFHFENYYYYSTEAQKEQILQTLQRDYTFRYELDPLGFWGPFESRETTVSAKEVVKQ